MDRIVKVTILSPYPFHMIYQANQMKRLNSLERLLTAVPMSRTGLPKSVVNTRLYFSGIRFYARKLLPQIDHKLSRIVIKDFDRWAKNNLGKPTIINALSGFATNTLQYAHDNGVFTCCDRGSWHILEQKKVLDDEAERLGVTKEYFDPWIMERELTEYDIVDRIFVPSQTAADSFIRQGVDKDKLRKVPYGVHIDHFVPSSSVAPPGAFVSVATVGMQKGSHILVEAFRNLNGQYINNSSLTLVGPITQGWERILELDKNNVIAVGQCDRDGVIRHLQQARIFVLASIQEGLALVIAQAMACGLPIIASEATGAHELVDNGVEGIIVPTNDVEALTNAMEFLISNPTLSKEMGLAARKKVEKFGGWNRYGEEINNELYRIITEKSTD